MILTKFIFSDSDEFDPFFNDFNKQLKRCFDYEIKYYSKEVQSAYLGAEKFSNRNDRHKEKITEWTENRIAFDKTILTDNLFNSI